MLYIDTHCIYHYDLEKKNLPASYSRGSNVSTRRLFILSRIMRAGDYRKLKATLAVSYDVGQATLFSLGDDLYGQDFSNTTF